MIKFLIFDLDGTLYEKKSVVMYYLQEFAKEEGLDLDFLHKKFTEAYLQAKKEKFSSTEEFWSRVHIIFLDGIKSKKIEKLETFANKAKETVLFNIKPRSNLIKFLSEAKKSGIKIIVFSGSEDMYDSINISDQKNNISKLRLFKQKQIARLGLNQYVDRIILSAEYGGYKPQKFVFEKLLENIKGKPEECIMIGDTYNDIGAVQLGIFSVLIDNNDTKEFIPNLRIKDFQELIDIIDFEKCMLKQMDVKEDQ